MLLLLPISLNKMSISEIKYFVSKVIKYTGKVWCLFNIILNKSDDRVTDHLRNY